MFDLEDPLWMAVEIEVHRSFGVVFLFLVNDEGVLFLPLMLLLQVSRRFFFWS
jgi:hypothetical protein